MSGVRTNSKTENNQTTYSAGERKTGLKNKTQKKRLSKFLSVSSHESVFLFLVDLIDKFKGRANISI